MTKSKTILALIGVLVVAALLLAGCGKTTAPTTTAPPTTARATTVAPTTAAPTTAAPTTVAPTTAPATTRPAATTAPSTTAPATTTAPGGVDMVKVTLTKFDGVTTMEKMVPRPKYGGTFSYAPSDPLGFDDYYMPGQASGTLTANFTNDRPAGYDWTLGPNGTGERSYQYTTSTTPEEVTRPTAGGIISKIEFTAPDTAVWTIRQGVRFALNPNSPVAVLVNGRELTADDVAFSLRRLWQNPRGGAGLLYWGALDQEGTKALDKYRAQIKWVSRPQMAKTWYTATTAVNIWPVEAEKFDLREWKNSVGTGPFILTDYVKASSATLERQPNYWMKDPFFPANRLPYIDTVKLYFITDLSTRDAALRTAKIDEAGVGYGGFLKLDDYRALAKTNPELVAIRLKSSSTNAIFLRVDKPELQWYDNVKVRKALSMAINRKEMLEQLYGGEAAITDWPAPDLPDYKLLYIPMSQLPASVQEIYEYNPEKAKQLLAEAGYPNGFKTEVLAGQTQVDWLPVVQNYWGKIGVDLTIDVKDAATLNAMSSGRRYTQAYAGGLTAIPFMKWQVGKGAWANYSMVDDPVIDEVYVRMDEAWPNQAKQAPILRELIPYVLEKVYWVSIPTPNGFVMKWPWVMNFQGEHGELMSTGTAGAKYIWIDQDLKKKMGR